MIIELRNPFSVITTKGRGRALALVDHGPDVALQILVEHAETGELTQAKLTEMKSTSVYVSGVPQDKGVRSCRCHRFRRIPDGF
jgi:hypothetical protein